MISLHEQDPLPLLLLSKALQFLLLRLITPVSQGSTPRTGGDFDDFESTLFTVDQLDAAVAASAAAVTASPAIAAPVKVCNMCFCFCY